jgi:3-isopropylmalate dehydrogenase
MNASKPREVSIVLLPGDGIGPEIVDAAGQVLEALAPKHGLSFSFHRELIGGAAIDASGDPLPEATLAACRQSEAILLGAVGGPKWDDPRAKVRPEQGLLRIRKALALFANLRPVKLFAALAHASPLKMDRLVGVDLLTVRELTGGIYFGQPRTREQVGDDVRAVDSMVYTKSEIERVMVRAFDFARLRRNKVTSVDKANVLETSRLWREVASEVAKRYPDVELEHQLVDSCAMRLVTHPVSFDVIVTENMFGDILSDEAAVLSGSLGVMPSASLGADSFGLYEPIHGSAPDIAGLGIANPVGTILSAAMMLRYSLAAPAAADNLEAAVERALDAGARTRDLGGSLSTQEMTNRVIACL